MHKMPGLLSLQTKMVTPRMVTLTFTKQFARRSGKIRGVWGGGGGGGSRYQGGPISSYNQVPIFSSDVEFNMPTLSFILAYRTSCRKPYFLRYNLLDGDGVNVCEMVGWSVVLGLTAL